VDASRNVLGLYFAGNPSGTYGVANPIQAVLTALDVTLCVTPKLKVADDPITIKFLDDTRKFIDDPTLKFADDPTLKFADDPTLKFADDQTAKFTDDLTIKFQDDQTSKFADDLTIKFQDDQTFKFADDPGKSKFTDDPGTSPQLDPYKSPAYDKNPVSDAGKPPAGDIGQPPVGGQPPFGGQHFGGASAIPFVLATPHHSQAFLGQDLAATQGAAAQMEARIQQIAQVLTQMQAARERGALSPVDQQRFAEGCAEYQALLAQARQMGCGC
jgi:hypothetical protein